MKTIPILSGVIMVTTAVTIVLAICSYTVYRLRELRKRKRESEAKRKQEWEPKYFTRFHPEESPDSQE